MPRPLHPAQLHVPVLVYAGEREALLARSEEIRAQLRRTPERSPYRRGLEHSLVRITARLMAIAAAPAAIIPPGMNRRDLQ